MLNVALGTWWSQVEVCPPGTLSTTITYTSLPLTIMTDTRKRHRSVSVSSGSSGISLPEDVPTKYHRAPSPDKEYLCTLPPTCSQPETAQRFASAAELDAHQTSFHKYLCRVPIRDKPGRIGEGALVPVMPEHFTGRMPGRAFNSKWRECGKAFPDGRLLEIVSAAVQS